MSTSNLTTAARKPASLTLGTKAATLHLLRQHLTHASVCRCVIFSVAQWRASQQAIVGDIQSHFNPGLAIIRSSALNEDGFAASYAGAFDSVKNVDCASPDAIARAVEFVIASYGPRGSQENEVLVQPMVDNVSMSGVIFSHDLSTGAPYYVVNYDDQTGLTDTVTSGSDLSRTLLVYRDQVSRLESPRFRALIRAVQEIEDLTATIGLDIEFAVTEEEEIYIFQARPMAASHGWSRDIPRKVAASLKDIRAFLETRFAPDGAVLGDTSLFAEMSDWNPAEMIGAVPRPLARSLYEKLITDSAWARARAELGYRDLSPRPLMVNLSGRVFIDVRESFNSFLPASLPDAIGEKLVTAWLQKLKNNPELHDKIEFDVVTTALSLDFDNDIASIHPLLSTEEIKIFRAALLSLTDNIILSGGEAQRERLAGLDARRHRFTGGNIPAAVENLLDDCIENGTIPFAVLARHGFIAETLLRSLTSRGLLSPERISSFRHSVPTVLTDFLDALHACQRDASRRDEFMRAYGHLRPGTYDILAGRYDRRAELMQSHGAPRPEPKRPEPFMLTTEESARIGRALSEAGFTFGAHAMLAFMRDAIAGREQAKLIFTRNVSDALELLAAWGQKHGLSRDDLSFLAIGQILHSPADNVRAMAAAARETYQISQALRLPYLIAEISDIYVVPMLKSRPNFITAGRVQAPVHYLSDHALESARCAGKIVLIERADPGYDWIFLSPIAGLVTQYGGANSHMAIRCAELNIPAAIGCGEQIFAAARQSSHLLLDCAAGLLVPVH